MRIKLIIWNSFEVTSVHYKFIGSYSTGLSRMDCDARDIPMLHSKADRHLRKWRLFCKWSGLTCVKTQFNAAILSFSKRIRTCKKQLVDISNILSELMLLASTCHVSLQYLKQYQFLVIDIDQLFCCSLTKWHFVLRTTIDLVVDEVS